MMNKKSLRNRTVRFIGVFLGIILLSMVSLHAKETLVTIADDGSYSYNKPEVKIHPNGEIYVVYQAQDTSGHSDIFLSKYGTNGKVSFVKNISDSSAHSYEQEIDIRSNGDIHIAWCDQSGDTCVIKYRYYNGSSWSGIQTFGQVGNTEEIEDLRIAVDDSGNVFVVFMHWNAAQCVFISKYGNDVTFESFPESGRSKHPDVAVDSNYVHIVWQYKNGSDYVIAHQRRPNYRNSYWETWTDLDTPSIAGVQRPRMSLDSSGNPHIVYFSKDSESTRRLEYKRWNGSTFTDFRIVSDPNSYQSYHYCEIVAVNSENILTTLQKGGSAGGRYIGYNWKQNGTWSGFAIFEKSSGPRPAKQSADLSSDSLFAAVAFVDSDERVYLILVDEGGSVGGGDAPTANFTYSPQGGHAPLTVTFDGSNSTDSDGTVVAYNWNFADGTTGTGQTIQHTFQGQGEYSVRLTVTDNDGKTGSTTHLIIVDPPNTPPTAAFSFSPLSGLYPLTVTFDASASSDSDGYVDQYEWEFGDEHTGSGKTITHTFTEEGLQKIVLTVYDDDGDSAAASGTVEVLGLLAPLNILYESKINRNLFTIQYVYLVTWNRNPANAQRGANIVQYNIHRKRPSETVYTQIGTLAAQDSNQYYDRLGSENEEYQYTVTAVDDQGRESKIYSSSSQQVSVATPEINDLKLK